MTNGKIMKKKEKQRIGRRKRLAPNNVDFQPIRNKTVHSYIYFRDHKYTLFFSISELGK